MAVVCSGGGSVGGWRAREEGEGGSVSVGAARRWRGRTSVRGGSPLCFFFFFVAIGHCCSLSLPARGVMGAVKDGAPTPGVPGCRWRRHLAGDGHVFSGHPFGLPTSPSSPVALSLGTSRPSHIRRRVPGEWQGRPRPHKRAVAARRCRRGCRRRPRPRVSLLLLPGGAAPAAPADVTGGQRVSGWFQHHAACSETHPLEHSFDARPTAAPWTPARRRCRDSCYSPPLTCVDRPPTRGCSPPRAETTLSEERPPSCRLLGDSPRTD